MNLAVSALVVGLTIWMVICAWCGFRTRPVRFLCVLFAGMAAYMLWIVLAFDAAPLEATVIMAMIAVVLYGISAFGAGYLVGRIARQFQASRVEDAGV